jgi:hypothetical protein
MTEAPLVPAENGGLIPGDAGWFVLNARDTRWLEGTLGAYCAWEGLDAARFSQLGVNLNVLEPGMPMAMYHRENTQEDFLVFAGECVVIVEGEERPLRQWDLFHCRPASRTRSSAPGRALRSCSRWARAPAARTRGCCTRSTRRRRGTRPASTRRRRSPRMRTPA